MLTIGISLAIPAYRETAAGGGGGGDPTPPTGFAFVVNGNGDYFVTQDGDYVVQEIA